MTSILSIVDNHLNLELDNSHNKLLSNWIFK